MNPVVAVALGAVVLGEPVTPLTLVAAALIVGAVALLLVGQSRRESRAGGDSSRYPSAKSPDGVPSDEG